MRLLRLLRQPTPMLAVGLGVFALSGSLFLSVSNDALSAKQYVPDSGALLELYFLLTTIGVGALGGLEQEMTRTISRDLSLGVSPLRTMRGQIRQAVVLFAITIVLVLACSPYIVHHWLNGRWYMFGELLIGLAGSCASYVIRGLLSGYQKFQIYSLTLVAEGMSRLIPGVVLWLAGVHQAWIYGLLYALAPVFASLVGLVGIRRTVREREPHLADPSTVPAVEGASDTVRRAARNMVLLTLATLASQVVLNGVPLGIPPRLDPAQRKALASAMGLVRLALLVVFPLQAPLLPKLTASATRGDMQAVRKQTGLLIGACVAVGLLGTAVSAAVGPWLVQHYLHSVGLTWQLMGVLAFGTTFLMIAYLLQSALIALRCHFKVLVAWVAGIVVLAVVLILPIAPLPAAGYAAVLSPAAVTLVMFVDLVRVTRARSRAGVTEGEGPDDSTTDLLEVSTQA